MNTAYAHNFDPNSSIYIYITPVFSPGSLGLRLRRPLHFGVPAPAEPLRERFGDLRGRGHRGGGEFAQAAGQGVWKGEKTVENGSFLVCFLPLVLYFFVFLHVCFLFGSFFDVFWEEGTWQRTIWRKRTKQEKIL